MPRLVCAAMAALALALPASAHATDFYLSVLGNDANSGLSSASPWRSFTPINAKSLQAGDRVLLRGGDTFDGTISLDGSDAGTATAPISVASYGTGRATIRGGTGSAIYAYNTAGISIANVNATGSGTDASGIVFYTDLPGNVKLAFIRLDSVDVGGFGRDGIEIGSWNGTAGFRDVRITAVSAHDNARTGILTYAAQPNAHQSVYVGYSRAFNNPGIAAATTNTGSGIVLGGVDGGTIERSVAHDNGRLCTASAGPVGIWAYDSRRIVIQQNESYNNRTGGPADGGGFDLDQNVSDSLLQYNYSHGNDGAGYLLAHAPINDGHHDNVIRFNISENDGRKNSYAGIEIWGRTIRAEIHNNTVFVSPAASGAARAVRVWNAGIPDRIVSGVHFRNNIFMSAGGVSLLDVSATQTAAADLRFEGNAYYASGSGLGIHWGATTYASLASWRATGEETIAGAATGLSVDPQLTSPGSGGTLDDALTLEGVSSYRLTPTSPLIDNGLDLVSRFGVDPGSRDYYATTLPQGAGFDVGAGELLAAASAADIVLRAASATTIAGAWRIAADSSAAGGARLWHPNASAPKVSTALAAPANYFELTFDAVAGQPYRLWLRARAENNYWANDSVFVQFSGAVTSSGTPAWRIGSSSAAVVNLEECAGCGLSGWGWQDDGYGAGVLGPLVYFAADGPQRLRVQTREDGVSIDQIVLSPATYLSTAPGASTNDATVLSTQTTVSLAEIVRYATDVPASAIHGDWSFVADTTAAAGSALRNPNRGAAKISSASASPSTYIDLPFTAEAGTDYQVWLRMKAEGNSTANDSVFLQFSGAVTGSGVPQFRLGTTDAAIVVLQDYSGAPLSGWGWNDTGWASLGAPVRFATAGAQTLRIQQREDGVVIDQIVISPRRYLTTPPGNLTNDNTIVVR